MAKLLRYKGKLYKEVESRSFSDAYDERPQTLKTQAEDLWEQFKQKLERIGRTKGLTPDILFHKMNNIKVRGASITLTCENSNYGIGYSGIAVGCLYATYNRHKIQIGDVYNVFYQRADEQGAEFDDGKANRYGDNDKIVVVDIDYNPRAASMIVDEIESTF